MKKGLSVLLIAAALFGFYGGATSLTDVLASKDYWEEQGEKSTADMNKLEDGLNQLKDNEKAYLDGQEQLADGEKALADAEVQLAEGEKKLADGRAELAKGYADYAAAPAKLADGERQLAAGKAELAAGYASYAAAPGQLADARNKIAAGEEKLAEGLESLKKLDNAIHGVNELLSGYSNTWRPGYENLKKGREQISEGVDASQDSLEALAVFLPANKQKAYLGAVRTVGDDNGNQTAEAYKDFIKGTNEIADDIPTIQKRVAALHKLANSILNSMNGAANNYEFTAVVSNNKSALVDDIAPLIAVMDPTLAEAFVDGVDKVAAAYDNFGNLVEMQGWPTFFASDTWTDLEPQVRAGAALVAWRKAYNKPDDATPQTPEEQQQYATIRDGLTDAQVQGAAKQNPQIKAQVEQAVKDGYDQNPDLNAGIPQLKGGVQKVVQTLNETNDKVNGKDSDLNTKLLPGLKQFNSLATEEAVDDLSNGQDTIANGIAEIASGVLANKTLKEGVRNAMGNDAIALLQAYSKSPNPANTKLANYAQFEGQMDTSPGIVAMLQKARQFLGNTKADGLQTYNEGLKELEAGKAQYAQGLADYEAAPAKLAAGEKKLAAGKAELAQGYADYAAAPAKLADGEKQLADGEKELADGYKQYEDGKKQLADGKKKLAEYEDGEQQVRDGLATLMATKADPGLESILDRRNGDDNFDDANGHLQLEKGLEAVDTGRGYQADSGELITKEVTNRAVGTAAGLGAAALAVLAAVLSFLKKNKGAAVSAVLAAVAGGIGAGVGFSAGEYYSDIAGSTVGNTPFIAALVLAIVAGVFAVVHFTAKPEAK